MKYCFLILKHQLHTKSFKAGVEFYSEESWQESVEAFEQAVANFIEADEECRMDCEKPFDMGWFPDFVTSVASEYFASDEDLRTAFDHLQDYSNKSIISADLSPVQVIYHPNPVNIENGFK